MAKLGLDLSEWQSKISFDAIKKSGIEFLILREGYRNKEDKSFESFVKQAKSQNIPIYGVYHFSYATSVEEAKNEALFAINNVRSNNLPKTTVIYYDFEYDTVTKALKNGVALTAADCVEFTKAFVTEIQNAGYTAGVYCNVDFYENWYEKELPDDVEFWLAHWADSPKYDCDMWQFSSMYKISGYSGNLDGNYMVVNPPTNAGIVADDVLFHARKFIGARESNRSHQPILDIYNNHKPLARGYKMKSTDAWCDAFVSAVAISAGAVDLIGTEVGCEKHVRIFKEKGIWIEDGTIRPQPGDIILFNWDDSTQGNDGYSDHIGFVEEVYGDTIVTIEGNYKDAVGRRTINIGWGYIRGFARPKYAEGIHVPATKPTATVNLIALQVLQGAWGNGQARKEALEAAGYDYAEVQMAVNKAMEEQHKVDPSIIAKEVIAGKWGNGQARKEAIEAAGYDYNTVQKEVNILLSK